MSANGQWKFALASRVHAQVTAAIASGTDASPLTPSQPDFACARHRALSLIVHKRHNQKFD
jgi:hypothetical protein